MHLASLNYCDQLQLVKNVCIRIILIDGTRGKFLRERNQWRTRHMNNT